VPQDVINIIDSMGIVNKNHYCEQSWISGFYAHQTLE